MQTSALVLLLAVNSVAMSIPDDQVKKQNESFSQWWDTDFVWKFEDLPTKGQVETYRVPYSGYIYPDTAGGTTNVLHKYDRAFNGGRSVAAAHERWDTTAFKEPIERRGLFGRRFTGLRMRTPDWYGHCNGWTAAAIRHAEPQHSVQRNGVVFSPSDIKGLLAEIYIYNDHDVLGGEETSLNAGTFHAILANWLGRGQHPLGMESDPGKEKWNYPVYAYASSSGRHSSRLVEVKTNIAFAKDSRGEFEESPRINQIKFFHYMLELNGNGEIVGGYFFRDSSIIDMLWVPLRPKKSGEPGNERGNPYVDVDTVLALWRDSVPEDIRRKWFAVDPAEADRVTLIDGILPGERTADDVTTEDTDTDTEAEDEEETTAEATTADATTASASVTDLE
jgi:hypothetical protein